MARDSIAQLVERPTVFPNVRVQILLELTDFLFMLAVSENNECLTV